MNDEQNTEKNLVRIYTLSNEVEQTLIEEVLKANTVAYVIKSFEDGALDGIYRPSHGLGEILVSPDDAEQAKQLIEKAVSS